MTHNQRIIATVFNILGSPIMILLAFILLMIVVSTELSPAHAEGLSFGEKLNQVSISAPSVTVDSFDDNTRLEDDQLREILAQVGFSDDQIPIAIAISKAESGARPKALCWTKRDRSYGLYQINLIGYLGKARMKQWNLTSPDDLFDPLVNAKIAYAMSNGGTNWYPWSAFKSGAYLRYL